MTFKQLNKKYFEPGAQGLMIFGIIALCQPWSFWLHNNGLILTLTGLVSFMITSKIPPEPEVAEDEQEDLV
ncbi:hypothetical protein [Tropicibacter sp. Alg240-R139]|uniref:hypothetical protein n=1 Tax=Tropicibacter sp. Alg240-R139 TaxID=2305991 RepID=UPI0013DF0587|nr:hypothetical protein [Tropicibacter sp. Alg240-R139]